METTINTNVESSHCQWCETVQALDDQQEFTDHECACESCGQRTLFFDLAEEDGLCSECAQDGCHGVRR